MIRRIGTVSDAAAEHGVTPRAIRYMISKGYVAPVYDQPNAHQGGLLYDLDEIAKMLPYYREKIYRDYYKSRYY